MEDDEDDEDEDEEDEDEEDEDEAEERDVKRWDTPLNKKGKGFFNAERWEDSQVHIYLYCHILFGSTHRVARLWSAVPMPRRPCHSLPSLLPLGECLRPQLPTHTASTGVMAPPPAPPHPPPPPPPPPPLRHNPLPKAAAAAVPWAA